MESLEEVYTEITNLYKTYSVNPMFGVEVSFEDVEGSGDNVQVPKVEDNLEIVDTGYSSLALPTNKSNYAIGGGSAAASKDPLANIMFCEELGLAIERPPKGVSVDQLWKIV